MTLADGGHVSLTLVDGGPVRVTLADGGHVRVTLADGGHVRVTLWCCWWLLTGENGVDKPRDPLCFPSKLVTPLHKQLDLMVVMTQPCGKDPDLMLVIIHKVVDLLPQPR